MRIETAGVLGAGKTNLVAQIYPTLSIFEDFNANPFLSSFYQNPNKFSFETEISFLLQHYHQIKKSSLPHQVCDFALIQDLAYGKMGLYDNKLRLFVDIYQEIIGEIGSPDVLIFLTCDIDILLKRIKKRGRKNEKAINTEFLSNLQKVLTTEINAIDHSKTKIIHFDTSTVDYEKDHEAIKDLLNQINLDI